MRITPHVVLRACLALAVALGLLIAPRTSRAEDPDRVEWSPDWPRVRVWEVADIVAFAATSYTIEQAFTPPNQPHWQGGILYDNFARDNLRAGSASGRANARSISDTLYLAGNFAPFIFDVYFAALAVHQNADVALQMFLINLQSIGLAGTISLANEEFVGRARPETVDCAASGCAIGGDNTSFLSGHASTTATVAGLTCVHHQHLPLYGGGVADLLPCLAMIGLSGVTGVERVVADRHWATDVTAGWLVGAFSGYVVPSVLHYGFGGGHAYGELHAAGVYAVPVPQAYPGGAGLGVAGAF